MKYFIETFKTASLSDCIITWMIESILIKNKLVILTKGDSIGKKIVIVAGLLATSVTEVTIRQDIRIISHKGNDPRGVNLFATHSESFETCIRNMRT